MSAENTVALFNKIEQDTALKAKFDQINTPEEFIRLAQEEGYEVTQEDINQIRSMGEESDELSEEQLEAVAGGGWGTVISIGSAVVKEGYAHGKKKGWF